MARTDFTDEEWAVLRRGLVAGEEAVRAAGPSGWFGRFKESRALKREWKSVEERYGHTALAQSLLAEEGGSPIASVRIEEGKAEDFITGAVASCRAAAAVLTAKVDAHDAEVYVDVAMELAETAALADREKGSDQKVSRGEGIILRRIAEAFGRTEYEAPSFGELGDVDDSMAVEETYARQQTN